MDRSLARGQPARASSRLLAPGRRGPKRYRCSSGLDPLWRRLRLPGSGPTAATAGASNKCRVRLTNPVNAVPHQAPAVTVTMPLAVCGERR